MAHFKVKVPSKPPKDTTSECSTDDQSSLTTLSDSQKGERVVSNSGSVGVGFDVHSLARGGPDAVTDVEMVLADFTEAFKLMRKNSYMLIDDGDERKQAAYDLAIQARVAAINLIYTLGGTEAVEAADNGLVRTKPQIRSRNRENR